MKGVTQAQVPPSASRIRAALVRLHASRTANVRSVPSHGKTSAHLLLLALALGMASLPCANSTE